MATKLNLYVGCNGNADKERFVFCGSCRNKLIEITGLEPTKRDKVMDFLDKVGGLFGGPVENHNKAFNIINMLYRDFGLFEIAQILKIQQFFQQHKQCGVYIVLIPEEK